MRSAIFTGLKRSTCVSLSHMIEQREDILSALVDDKNRYESADLVHICEEGGISVGDCSECDRLFEENEGIIEVIWCNNFLEFTREEWSCAASVAAVSFHLAPLPRYRRVFAFNFATPNGDHDYGVMARLLGKKFDQGDNVEVGRFPYYCGEGSVEELVTLSEEKKCELFKGVYGRCRSSKSVLATPQEPDGRRCFNRSDFEEVKRIVPGEDSAMTERRIRAFWYPSCERAYADASGLRFAVVSKEVFDALGARH